MIFLGLCGIIIARGDHRARRGQEGDGMDEITKRQELITTGIFSNWLNYLDAKPKTKETYTRNIRPFAEYVERKNIKRPEREDLLAYRDEIAASHKPTTTAAYIYAVKAFFTWAEEMGLYPNIAKTVKGPKISKDHKKDYFAADQVKEILAKIDRTTSKGKRDFAIIALMVTTGLRTIEVQRANVEDVTTLAGAVVLFVQGKGHDEKDQYVKIEKPVYEAIAAYEATRKGLSGKDPLFGSEAGKNSGAMMTTRSISRLCKEAMAAAGIVSNRLTAHSFRHTAATLNLKAGGTLEETKQLLRHESIETTLIYSHALTREENRSEARVTAAVFG